MRFLVKIILPVAFAAALLAGCGGGGAAGLDTDDVAVVGDTHITRSEYDTLLAQAKRSLGKQFPKEGTPQFESIKSRAVILLVQQAERAEKADSEGITVSAKKVDERLAQIKKQYFHGSDKAYQRQLKQQHLTDAQVRHDVRSQLIYEAIVAKVTKGVAVSDSEIHDYYIAHPQLYSKAQTRDVRHILVKSKQQAQSIYAQLKAGNDKTWCTLAKKFSQDPSSKNACGKLTVSKGQTVPDFDRVAFSEKTKVIHAPVHNATYGWFVIEPLSKIHPRTSTPEKQVAPTIKQQLLQQKKNQQITDWFNSLTKSYCGDDKLKYQVGFKPTPDPCASTTSSNLLTT